MSQKNVKFRKRKVCFTQVSNHLLDDKTLSWKAKGIYSLIQRYITIDDWDISIDHLISMSTDGIKSFKSGWKELKERGYLKQYRIPSKENRGKFVYEYELLDEADTSTPGLINCDINGNYTLYKDNKEEDKLEYENDHIPQNGMYGQIKNDHIPQKGPYAQRTICLKDTVLNGGDNNNTNINNTNYNNTNISSSSIENKNKTYCSLEDPIEVDRKIDELIEFTLGTFRRLDYKKFLNASNGDVEIVKYVYENTLRLYSNSDDNVVPIDNMVMYIIRGIEKEFKSL